LWLFSRKRNPEKRSITNYFNAINW
jgi:hypothetical protein